MLSPSSPDRRRMGDSRASTLNPGAPLAPGSCGLLTRIAAPVRRRRRGSPGPAPCRVESSPDTRSESAGPGASHRMAQGDGPPFTLVTARSISPMGWDQPSSLAANSGMRRPARRRSPAPRRALVDPPQLTSRNSTRHAARQGRGSGSHAHGRRVASCKCPGSGFAPGWDSPRREPRSSEASTSAAAPSVIWLLCPRSPCRARSKTGLLGQRLQALLGPEADVVGDRARRWEERRTGAPLAQAP